LAQEIAKAEKERIFYQKLKVQSDRLLMNLNIRTNKMRARGAVVERDEQSCSSDLEEEVVGRSGNPLVKCPPIEFTTLCSVHKDKKVFVLCIPCDFPSDAPVEIEKTIQDAFESLRESNRNRGVVFAMFSKKLCICGHCSDADSRPTGTLRSVAMILKNSPSVVLTRNSGLIGIWTDKDGPLDTFVSKHI
jgi:hypothetical protein